MTSARALLVTGGSRGIGAAVARKAARDGWRVAVNYVSNADAANKVVAEIVAAGGDAFPVRGDLGSEADILTIYKAIDTRWGRIDGLVNNAGALGSRARVEEMDAERIEWTMRVNVTGAILCAREAVKRMSTRFGGKGGVIVKSFPAAAARLGKRQLNMSTTRLEGGNSITFTRGLALEKWPEDAIKATQSVRQPLHRHHGAAASRTARTVCADRCR